MNNALASIQSDELTQIARSVALVNLKRGAPGMLNQVDHYMNQAWITMLEAAEGGGFDPRKGTARSFFARAAYFGVKRALTKDRSPVSGSESRVANCKRADLEGVSGGTEDRTDGILWDADVRRALQAEFSDLPPVSREAGIEVLLGLNSKAAAEEYRVDVRDLYRITAKMKARIRKSKRFGQLASAIKETP